MKDTVRQRRRSIQTPRKDVNLLSESQKAEFETLTLLPLCDLGQVSPLSPLHLRFPQRIMKKIQPTPSWQLPSSY